MAFRIALFSISLVLRDISQEEASPIDLDYAGVSSQIIPFDTPLHPPDTQAAYYAELYSDYHFPNSAEPLPTPHPPSTLLHHPTGPLNDATILRPHARLETPTVLLVQPEPEVSGRGRGKRKQGQGTRGAAQSKRGRSSGPASPNIIQPPLSTPEASASSGIQIGASATANAAPAGVGPSLSTPVTPISDPAPAAPAIPSLPPRIQAPQLKTAATDIWFFVRPLKTKAVPNPSEVPVDGPPLMARPQKSEYPALGCKLCWRVSAFPGMTYLC